MKVIKEGNKIPTIEAASVSSKSISSLAGRPIKRQKIGASTKVATIATKSLPPVTAMVKFPSTSRTIISESIDMATPGKMILGDTLAKGLDILKEQHPSFSHYEAQIVGGNVIFSAEHDDEHISTASKIAIPVTLGSHFSIFLIDKESRTWTHYDPTGSIHSTRYGREINAIKDQLKDSALGVKDFTYVPYNPAPGAQHQISYGIRGFRADCGPLCLNAAETFLTKGSTPQAIQDFYADQSISQEDAIDQYRAIWATKINSRA